MQWMAPMTAIYAAAVATPLLVLMYFLKLKRREQLISSTLLWKRAIQDLQVNAPFQRLRKNILLLLQLLALTAFLLALGRPVLQLQIGPGKRYVLLIDRSGSMNATDANGSRLDAAREQGRTIVQSLRSKVAFSLTEKSDQGMVIAFADQPKVMCNFTSDKRQLLRAIDAIEPTDGLSVLGEALRVARAFAQAPGEDTNDRSGESPAQLELFSDGRIRDATEIVVKPGELNYHKVGEGSDNVAVVAMQARRRFEDPQTVKVFATLVNYSPNEVLSDVQLSVDGDVRAVRPLRLPPSRPGDGQEQHHGTGSVVFEFSHPGAGIVEVRQLRKDLLGCDDAARTILQPPAKLNVLLVTEGNLALQSALKVCPLGSLNVRTPVQFDSMDPIDPDTAAPYDVIVLDNCSPAKLPRGRYLIFGSPPKNVGIEVGDEITNQVAVDWEARSPVLEFVDLSGVFVAKTRKMTLPRDADILCEFNNSPAISLLRRHGSPMLLVGFDVLESNWCFEPGFVMFCYNALSFLGTETASAQESSLRVSTPITIEGLSPDLPGKVIAPVEKSWDVRTDASGTLRFAGTNLTGLYSVHLEDCEPKVFAVNSLDIDESNITPVREIVFSGEMVKAQSGAPQRSNVELLPLLVLLVLVLVLLEWIVYNSKVKL